MEKMRVVETEPEKAYMLPYAPAVRIPPSTQYFFLSGALEGDVDAAFNDDVADQTTRVMERHTAVLEANGLTWDNVVHVYELLTDMRDTDEVHKAMGSFLSKHGADPDWKPANTLLGINRLLIPGARFELDVVAALPTDQN